MQPVSHLPLQPKYTQQVSDAAYTLLCNSHHVCLDKKDVFLWFYFKKLMTLPTRWNASDQSLWHQTAAESWSLGEAILKRFMFPAMYGGKGNVDESQVCLQHVWVGNVAPVVITFLSLQPKDFARWLVHGLSDRGRCCCTDSKASSVRNTQSQVHTGFRQGEMERCFCRVEGRWGIMIRA